MQKLSDLYYFFFYEPVSFLRLNWFLDIWCVMLKNSAWPFHCFFYAGLYCIITLSSIQEIRIKKKIN